jgi:hypothetical protein
VLLAPLCLEFSWGEIAQRRMDPLVHIHVIQEAANLVIGIMMVEILRQVNLLVRRCLGPNRRHHAFGFGRSDVKYNSGSSNRSVTVSIIT